MSWSYTRRVKYYETDRMGVVHHSNYLRFLEDARMEWVNDNIMRYSDMEKAGVIIPAFNATGNFKGFLHFDDPFTVTIRLIQYTGVRFTFDYVVTNDSTGQICYTGTTTHFFCNEGYGDKLEYRPMTVKHKFPEIHQWFMAMLEEE